MKIEKMLEAAAGIYLMLPGPEDWATGGLTIGPSAAVGALLVADAFGVSL